MQSKSKEPITAIRSSVGSPQEMFAELAGALAHPCPSAYFRARLGDGTLAAHFPEVAALADVPQHPGYHPEGNAFEHTMIVLDRVARQSADPRVRFAALVHDMGKTLTPPADNYLWHTGHEHRVAAILDRWHARMPLPADWLTVAKLVGELHMQVPCIKKAEEVVDVLEKMLPSPLAVEDLVLICQADDMTGNKPPVDLTLFVDAFQTAAALAPPGLAGNNLQAWIKDRRCMAIAHILAGSPPAR